MTYATMMVHLDAGRSNAAVLDVAAAMAAQYEAQVIGIAACQPMQLSACEGYVDAALAVAVRDIVDDELQHVEAEFRAHEALRPHVLEWRCMNALDPIAHVVAIAARSADLVITSAGSGHLGDQAKHADAGELIVRAGRPVLVVPETAAPSAFETVMVAWNDTRECRRAILDALPVLRHAERVIVVELTSDTGSAELRVDDVVAWLARHDVSATKIVANAHGSHVEHLALIAVEEAVDLIVAGAYGHNRLREWAFGGVTSDLLLRADRCAMLSH